MPGAARHSIICRAAAPALELRGRPVKLEPAAPGTPATWPRWMQIAGEGLYLGHPSGPFEFNAAVFADVVRNFRALPEYKAGAVPVAGAPGVIPYDWRHASERSPLDGGGEALAAQVAQGWIWELDIRQLADHTLGLFAYSEMLEPARGYIDSGKIAWTSVCVWPDSKDRFTNEPIGAYLSSVALTNDPFIRGMVPVSIAAEATRYIDYYEIPKTAGELVEALRALFGLSVQAPLVDVLRELLTLKACAAGEMPAPAGVDVVHLVGCLRRLFNLETIASPADVFAKCDLLLGAVAAEEALSEAAEPPSSRLPPMTAAARRAARPNKEPTMDQAALLAMLAGALKCAATPDAIAAHFPIFCAKAEADSKEGKCAKDKLGTLLAALGVQDPEAAMEKIGSTLKMSADLLAAMPELAEMYEQKAEGEDEEADSDIAMAADRLGALPPSLREDAKHGVFFSRTGGVELVRLMRGTDGKPDWKVLLDSAKRAAMFGALRTRLAARDAFRKKLGLDKEEQTRAGGPPAHNSALFKRWAAPADQQGGGAGMTGPMRGSQQFDRSSNGGRQGGAPDGDVIDIDLGDSSSLPGENPGQRAMAYVRQNPKLFSLTEEQAERDHDRVHEIGSALAADWRAQVSASSAGPQTRF